MNQQQRKYALERVDYILRSRLDKITSKHNVKPKFLTKEQRFKDFKSGNWSIITDAKKSIDSYSTKVCDLVSFRGDVPGKANSKAIIAESEKLRSEAAKICDQIMLGDAQEALSLIENFAKH